MPKSLLRSLDNVRTTPPVKEEEEISHKIKQTKPLASHTADNSKLLVTALFTTNKQSCIY
jgi:hypothetical protein